MDSTAGIYGGNACLADNLSLSDSPKDENEKEEEMARKHSRFPLTKDLAIFWPSKEIFFLFEKYIYQKIKINFIQVTISLNLIILGELSGHPSLHLLNGQASPGVFHL